MTAFRVLENNYKKTDFFKYLNIFKINIAQQNPSM